MFHLTVQEIQLLLSSKHSGVPRYSQEIIFFKKCPWHDCIMVGMATHQPFPIPLPHTCYQPQLLRAGHLPPNTLLLGDPEAQPQGRGGAGPAWVLGNGDRGAGQYLSGGTTTLGGLCRYCLKRSSKAWPTVLMTLWARPSQHSRM